MLQRSYRLRLHASECDDNAVQLHVLRVSGFDNYNSNDNDNSNNRNVCRAHSVSREVESETQIHDVAVAWVFNLLTLLKVGITLFVCFVWM